MERNTIVFKDSNELLNALESGKVDIGVLFFHEITASIRKGRPIATLYPLEGVIPIPTYMGILKNSPRASLASQVYDAFLSTPVQTLLAKNGVHSPFPKIPPPDKGRPWSQMKGHTIPWSTNILLLEYRTRPFRNKEFRRIFTAQKKED